MLYVLGRRYPVVIQSDYGVFPTNFFGLYGFVGTGLGPSVIATEAAQLLANRQIMVVEARVHTKDGQSHHEAAGARNRDAGNQLLLPLMKKA